MLIDKYSVMMEELRTLLVRKYMLKANNRPTWLQDDEDWEHIQADAITTIEKLTSTDWQEQTLVEIMSIARVKLS